MDADRKALVNNCVCVCVCVWGPKQTWCVGPGSVMAETMEDSVCV